jgi:carboxymethylenebutenolidase
MIVLNRPEGPTLQDQSPTRRGIGGLFFAGYAAAAFSAAAQPIVTDDSGLVIESVALPAQDFALPAYLARPRAAGRFPAIIVASEIFGLHAYIKDVCRRLAKLGYVAIAPAFFVRVADPAPISDIAAVVKIVSQASDPQVMSDIAAAIKFLQAQTYFERGKIAITGFCWGGGTTWLACETFPQIKSGVAWYGRMSPPANAQRDPNRLWPIEHVNELRSPVLGLYGAKDPLATQVTAMRQALASAGKSSSEIFVYPDAGHGFHADYRDSYNAADAADGWARMLKHFAEDGVGPKPFRIA